MERHSFNLSGPPVLPLTLVSAVDRDDWALKNIYVLLPHFFFLQHTPFLSFCLGLLHLKDSCRVCTEFESADILGRLQSLAHKGHPSMQCPLSVMLILAFKNKWSLCTNYIVSSHAVCLMATFCLNFF